MDSQIQSYPVVVFYLTALVGLFLLFYRPRWAFLFVVFGLAIRNYHMAVQTRSLFLGEFVNLNDLFLWIGVLTVVRTGYQERRIWVPNILLAIIAILVIGDFQAVIQYGFVREVMQSLWASWTFPLMFAVATNMVNDSQEARHFYWALFLGALGAALQHLIFVQGQAIISDNFYGQDSLRTISFMMSGGLFLVISSFFVDMKRILRRSELYAFWVASIPLIAVSYILSFTRSLWAEAVVTIGALFVIFYRDQRKILSRLGYALSLLAIILLAFQLTNHFLVPQADLVQMIDERADFIKYEDTFEEAYKTRETGLETEISLWQQGTIIWGVGSSYPPSLLDASFLETGALHHVGFSSYLAHFGLIGLFTYGILLPLLTIRVGRRYYLLHESDFGGVVALTALSLAIFDALSLLSNHYLGATSQIQGLIYGSLWGLSRSLEAKPVSDPIATMLVRQSREQRLIGPAR